MSKVNLDVQSKLQKLKEEWGSGVMEGMQAAASPLPAFYFKPYVNLKPRERGFIFGRSLVLDESLYAMEGTEMTEEQRIKYAEAMRQGRYFDGLDIVLRASAPEGATEEEIYADIEDTLLWGNWQEKQSDSTQPQLALKS